MSVLSLVPSGLYQVSVDVGTPSDTHFYVTVRPIHDLAADEVTLSIYAGSGKKILQKRNPHQRKPNRGISAAICIVYIQ